MKLTHYEHPQLQKLRRSGSLFGSSVFDDLFNDFWGYAPRQPHAELSEDDSAYYVRIELPGVKKESIHLELTDSTLTVSSRTANKSDDAFSSEAGVESSRFRMDFKKKKLLLSMKTGY